VRSIPGPKYTVGPRCSHCGKFADHAHHLFRRTRQGGPTDWVEVDGAIHGNVVALCFGCHRQITGDVGIGHAAAIRLDADGCFVWCRVISGPDGRVSGYEPERPLAPQPPTPESLATTPRDSGDSGKPESACPFCGQVKRRRSVPPFGRRRKSWRILVPDDAEDGAEVLDTLVDDLGLVLGVDPTATGRYYIVLPAVYYAHQEKARFIESVQGVGG